MMSFQETLTELADKVLAHLGIKVRYSVQVSTKHGWIDLNQTWEGAKKAPYSVTRTVADARTWKNRYDSSFARHAVAAPATRIVRQVTTFDVVQ